MIREACMDRDPRRHALPLEIMRFSSSSGLPGTQITFNLVNIPEGACIINSIVLLGGNLLPRIDDMVVEGGA